MPDYTPKFKIKTTFPLKSYELFEQRRWYKQKTSELFRLAGNNYIDLWYQVPFYGKVNREGVLLVPREDKISFSSSYNLSVFDFVLDAFKEFITFLERATSQGRTGLKRLLNNFSISESFFSSKGVYLEYSMAFMNSFNEYVISQNIKILNLEKYICEFIKFLTSSRSYFSFYSLYAGRFININATGLAFEFDLKNHDDDSLKNIYFQHPEFKKYVQTAANFGFRVNKNAPWMLVADLQSVPMTRGHKIRRAGKIINSPGYLLRKSIPDLETLFISHYDNAMIETFFLLREIILEGYNDLYQRMRFFVDHGHPIASIDFTFQNISDIEITRTPIKTLYMENLANRLDSERDKPKPFVDLLEKILFHEFQTKTDRRYKAFRKQFDKRKDIDHIGALEVLEKFYNPTKIFDFITARPLWTQPTKDLTFKNEQNMIPDEKDKPTIEKVVFEFYTGE